MPLIEERGIVTVNPAQGFSTGDRAYVPRTSETLFVRVVGDPGPPLYRIKRAWDGFGADCDLIEWNWPRFRSYFDG